MDETYGGRLGLQKSRELGKTVLELVVFDWYEQLLYGLMKNLWTFLFTLNITSCFRPEKQNIALVKQIQMTEVLTNTIFQRQIKQEYICAK
ncbi:hypothetical protein GBA52_026394 [Prunus armeniaca]|nr:hypothetical protein GBA52_026394 [Prunus armeniaca]